MGVGFELEESMSGTFHRFDEPFRDRRVRVKLRLSIDGITRFLRERRLHAQGTLVAEALAENGGAGRDVRGTVFWRLLDEKRVPYALTFEGDDGRTYHLRGQRDFFAYDAVKSLRSLEASLYDDAAHEIGRAVLVFEPRMELPALLKSFRLRFRSR